MLAIFLSTIKSHWKTVAILLIVNLTFLFMFTSIWPSLLEQAEDLEQLYAAYPEEFLDALGATGNIFSNFESFLAVEHYSITWPLMMAILVIGMAGAAFAGEIERGTMDLLMSQPLRRIELFLSKFGAGVVVLAIFSLLTILMPIPLAAMFDIELNVSGHFALLALGLLFGLAVYCMGEMLSAMFASRGMVGAIMAGVLIVMYGISIVARLEESLEFLQYGSYFYYFDFMAALTGRTVDQLAVAVFALSSLVFTIIGVFAFNKRDL
ncbi:MAG: ABC transporter permease subunit [Candidatus Dojkabacteria bacterium]|nr:MAG: ABC transporter permease subunit [Candidatus Dojkabacteria bacterium]